MLIQRPTHSCQREEPARCRRIRQDGEQSDLLRCKAVRWLAQLIDDRTMLKN